MNCVLWYGWRVARAVSTVACSTVRYLKVNALQNLLSVSTRDNGRENILHYLIIVVQLSTAC